MFNTYNHELPFDENTEFRVSVFQAVLKAESLYPPTARAHFDNVRSGLHRAKNGEPSTELDFAFFLMYLDPIRLDMEDKDPEAGSTQSLQKILQVVHEGLCVLIATPKDA